jgi:hypothetical protein
VSLFGSGGISAGCAMIFGIVLLRLLKVHMAPTPAVGLLPQIIDSPGIRYPLSVSIGTAALTLTFLLHRRWIVGQGRADGVPNNMTTGAIRPGPYLGVSRRHYMGAIPEDFDSFDCNSVIGKRTGFSRK